MTLSCHSRQISSFDTWKVMSYDLMWPTGSENERASWASKLIFQIVWFLNQTTDAETEVGRAACSDFSLSPVFLCFRRMAMQPKGVSWGKQCQQKSLSHGNSGAVALESCSRRGLAVLLERKCWLLYIIYLLSWCPFLPPGLLCTLIHPLCSEKMLVLRQLCLIFPGLCSEAWASCYEQHLQFEPGPCCYQSASGRGSHSDKKVKANISGR